MQRQIVKENLKPEVKEAFNIAYLCTVIERKQFINIVLFAFGLY